MVGWLVGWCVRGRKDLKNLERKFICDVICDVICDICDVEVKVYTAVSHGVT